MKNRLSLSFYQQETTQVAKRLLGCTLSHKTSSGVLLTGRIVETEAYLGLKDPCCHSYHGKMTPRTEVMYRSGGAAYVYFIYGMHYCFNVVTRAQGFPEAVLVRAIEPLDGINQMRKNRKIKKAIIHLTNGPGKLCQALGIDKTLNGSSLRGHVLYIEDGRGKLSKEDIETTARIGMPKEEPAGYWPLRFYIKGNSFVSRASEQ